MSRRLITLFAFLLLAVPLTLLSPSIASAQSDAAKILEKSRAQAREMEELRKVLNGPDQNMRLATFDAMLKSGNQGLRLIAYEAGLASADSIMREMAFRAVMASMDKLYITLTPDPSAPKALQDAAERYISQRGTTLVVPMKHKDMEPGKFDTGNGAGQISGLVLVFTYSSIRASMKLQDDNSLSGTLQLANGNDHGQFLAKAKLR